jgi:hypothetical protein
MAEEKGKGGVRIRKANNLTKIIARPSWLNRPPLMPSITHTNYSARREREVDKFLSGNPLFPEPL